MATINSKLTDVKSGSDFVAKTTKTTINMCFETREAIGDVSKQKESENLILNPDCTCKLFLDFIREKCKVDPKDVVDLIDENAWASELFTKNPNENVVSLFSPRGVYILASVELYEDNTIKKITPLLQDWEKKYQFLERKLKHWDKKQQKIAEEKTEAELLQNGAPKENKEGKLIKKKSERGHSASGSSRKETKSPLPDATSSPKKTKKKRKVST